MTLQKHKIIGTKTAGQRGTILIFVLVGMAIIASVAVGTATLQKDRRFSMDAEDMAGERFYDATWTLRSMAFRRTVTARRSSQIMNDFYTLNVAPAWVLVDLQRRGLDVEAGQVYLGPSKSMRSDYMYRRMRKRVGPDIFKTSAEERLKTMDQKDGEAAVNLNEFSRVPIRRN